MRRLFACSVALSFAAAVALAQPPQPKSPPASASVTIGGQAITITYNSPRVSGRVGKLFGKDGRIAQDKTYPVWRAGANAATKFHADADIDLAGLAVPKGDYTLYVDLADPAAWKLIVSKQTGQWGMTYDQAMDLGRVDMVMARPPALVEELKYTLTDEGGGKGKLTLAWENVVAAVPFTVK